MPLLFFNMSIINYSALWLRDLVSHVEVLGASLLYGYNFVVVHVNLIYSVVVLRTNECIMPHRKYLPIKLSEDQFTEFIVSLMIS